MHTSRTVMLFYLAKGNEDQEIKLEALARRQVKCALLLQDVIQIT